MAELQGHGKLQGVGLFRLFIRRPVCADRGHLRGDRPEAILENLARFRPTAGGREQAEEKRSHHGQTEQQGKAAE
ncbi:MAG TPA: hypothetical protein VGI83_09070 [Gemmatimonadales bacterium]